MFLFGKNKQKRETEQALASACLVIADSGLFDFEYYKMSAGETANPVMHYLTVGEKKGFSPHPLFDQNYYRSQTAVDESTYAFVDFVTRGLNLNISPHILFDPNYYLDTNKDVKDAGMSAFKHYVSAGFAERRNPHPLFDSKFYLRHLERADRNHELTDCGDDPLRHYLLKGSTQRLSTHPLFDVSFYLQNNQNNLIVENNLAPLEHYLSTASAERRKTHCLFDADFYRSNYPDLAQVDALQHYLLHGFKEKRKPGLAFDISYYQDTYGDLDGQNPLLHFLHVNVEGNPNCVFDTRFYVQKYPEVRDYDGHAFEHYVKVGSAQGYSPASWFDPVFYKQTNKLAETRQASLLLHYLQNRNEALSPTHPLLNQKKSTDKADILIYSIVRWGSRKQRPQQLALQFAELGHRVFFIDREFKHSLPGPGFSFDVLQENLYLINLHVSYPTVNFDVALPDKKQLAALTNSLCCVKNSFDMQNTIAIVQYPAWRKLAEHFSADYIVFDCMDHVAGFDVGEEIIGEEDALVLSADLMAVTSIGLKENFSRRSDIEIVRNAADVEFFGRTPEQLSMDLQTLKKPIIGYYGAIAEWFDIELLEYVAKCKPDWNFVLVGHITCDVSKLEKLSNVQFFGEKQYSELPGYLYSFDVCLIPFRLNELTRCTNPVKVYEYLAAGKPVVATAMPELELLEEVVSIGRTPEEYLAKIKNCLDSNSGDLVASRKLFVREQTWKSRAQELLKVAEQSKSRLPKVSVVVLSFNNLALSKLCLESLMQYTNYPNFELVLVDNASSDGSPEYFRLFGEQHPDVKVILSDRNDGFSAGNNLGIAQATGDIIVLLNNDTQVTDGWILSLVRHFEADKELGLVGPVTNNIGNEAKIDIEYSSPDVMRQRALEYTAKHGRKRLYVDNLAFFCVAIKGDVIKQIGVLDERFGLGFYEDDDYCKRTRNALFTIAIADDSFVHHELSASWNANKQKQRDEYLERNRKIFEEKWGQPWVKHRYRERSAD